MNKPEMHPRTIEALIAALEIAQRAARAALLTHNIKEEE